MIMDRMPTGVPGLDEIFIGGIIANRSYLLVGGAGTGKTILSLQWLNKGVQLGEKCLYITLAERADDLKFVADGFKWDFDKIDIVDLSPQGDTDEVLKKSVGEEYLVFSPSEVEHLGMWGQIYKAIIEKNPKRLVIDSTTQLRYLSNDEYQFRKQMLNLIANLDRRGITAFLLDEPTEIEYDVSMALVVYSIIHFRMDISKNRVIALRSLEVAKLRGGGFLSGYHPFIIKDDGLEIFPHRIEHHGITNPGEYIISSGVKQIDLLLCGGLESGTTTIISGPTGIGKSTLGMQFLENMSSKNSPAVLYTFSESTNCIINRCENIGIHLKQKLKQGFLRIVQINPMEIYPDQFLAMIRHTVEQEKFKLVMIDSLQDYQLAMEQFGTLFFHIKNLVNYLNSVGATSILINEIEAITGDVKVTEFCASHFNDNTILLRYAENKGQIIKVITCLKKRLSDFQPELRQFRITSNGIEVSEKLATLHGILTGVPTSDN